MQTRINHKSANSTPFLNTLNTWIKSKNLKTINNISSKSSRIDNRCVKMGKRFQEQQLVARCMTLRSSLGLGLRFYHHTQKSSKNHLWKHQCLELASKVSPHPTKMIKLVKHRPTLPHSVVLRCMKLLMNRWISTCHIKDKTSMKLDPSINFPPSTSPQKKTWTVKKNVNTQFCNKKKISLQTWPKRCRSMQRI